MLHPKSESAGVSVERLNVGHCLLIAPFLLGSSSPLEQAHVVKEHPQLGEIRCIVEGEGIHQVLQLKSKRIRVFPAFPRMGHRNHHRILVPQAPLSDILQRHQSRLFFLSRSSFPQKHSCTFGKIKRFQWENHRKSLLRENPQKFSMHFQRVLKVGPLKLTKLHHSPSRSHRLAPPLVVGASISSSAASRTSTSDQLRVASQDTQENQ